MPLVCSRLIGGKDVPADVVKAARSCLNTPADILRYKAGAVQEALSPLQNLFQADGPSLCYAHA